MIRYFCEYLSILFNIHEMVKNQLPVYQSEISLINKVRGKTGRETLIVQKY